VTARPQLRAELASGQCLLGTFSIIPSREVIELIALAGFDFVIIDMEHGPYGLESVRDGLITAHGRNLQTIVRVPDAQAALIGAVLDLGAGGVLVPQIHCAEDARAAVEAARFTPEGSRGAHPWVRASGYGNEADWFAKANAEAAVLVMIEGVDGIKAVPQILDVPGLDGIFLGPVDLSHSMGVPGQTEHPLVIGALEEVAAAASTRGMASAVFAPDWRRAQSWWPLGIRLIACGVDTKMIGEQLAAVAAQARAPGH
jgi:4-hydroxy-2-oxoheptanedioate aldolase